jgi:F0F1-type ATP synthase assembly protein I
MAQRVKKESQTRSNKAVYQGGTEAVFAVLIAGGIGHWIDGYLGSEPRGLLIGIGIGFGSFALRLFRMTRQIQRQYADEAKQIEEAKSEGK